ncbi:MAG: hypothetical protein NTZ84_02090 [Candidatus Nealsonbacteria bacterium]|nr:hypothetical protein [Candidatus Nealsonbacteria bacterium]
MIVDIIAFSVFLAGLMGIGVILFRKVPVLVELPETASSYFTWQGFFLKTGKGTFLALKNFFKRIADMHLVKSLVHKIKTSAKAKDLFEKLKGSTLVRKLTPSKRFSLETLLQKILSKVRVLVLKIDHKTSNWLQTLRERAKKRSTLEKDNYWKKLKNLTKK